MNELLVERLQQARQDVVNTKICLRHAGNEKQDFLVWFNSSVNYTALGKNEPARKLALSELLAKDERAHKYEQIFRQAEDDNDNAQCALDCVLDEVKAGREETWAKLADWVSTRTASGQMGSLERSGKELLKEQVEEIVWPSVSTLLGYHRLKAEEEAQC